MRATAGLVQRHGSLAQGSNIGLSQLTDLRPAIMLTWLSEGSMSAKELAENFKIKSKRKLRPIAFSFSQLQPEDRACIIEKSHLGNNMHFRTASAKISDEGDRSMFHFHVV